MPFRVKRPYGIEPAPSLYQTEGWGYPMDGHVDQGKVPGRIRLHVPEPFDPFCHTKQFIVWWDGKVTQEPFHSTPYREVTDWRGGAIFRPAAEEPLLGASLASQRP